MARIRSIKPEFFKHEDLFDLEAETGLPVRLAFAGLWTVADREGRFKWRPRTIKNDVLPYDEVDFEAVLNALAGAGFIERYVVEGESYGRIPSFSDHQHVNAREAQSKIPPPSCADTCTHVHARGEGKGKEGKEYSEAKASGAQVAPGESSEVKLYRVGKEVLGQSAGGQITKLRRLANGDDAEALRLVEVARSKQDPSEWIAAVLRGDEAQPLSMADICPPAIYGAVL